MKYRTLMFVSLSVCVLSALSYGCDDEPSDPSGDASAGHHALAGYGGGHAAGAEGRGQGGSMSGQRGGLEPEEGGATEQGFSDDGSPSDGLGRYQVAYQTLNFTYELPEPLIQSLSEGGYAEGGLRSLRLALWYPTEVSEGPRASYPLLARVEGALLDAEPAPLSGRAPVLLYSHGAKVWPELGVFMHSYFASHGWVVAAVEHDLDSVQSVTQARPDAMYLLRPLDVSEALSHLVERKAQGGHPVAALIDERFVMAAGHSFGGYTSYALGGARFDLERLERACAEISDSLCAQLPLLSPLFESGSRDPRVSLIAPQSSGGYSMFSGGVRAVEVPTLHVTAMRDQACTEDAQNRPYWEALSGSSQTAAHRWLSFKEGGHASLTMSCEQFPTLELDDGCGPDFSAPAELQALTNHYTLSFARAHFGADEASRALVDSPVDDALVSLTLP